MRFSYRQTNPKCFWGITGILVGVLAIILSFVYTDFRDKVLISSSVLAVEDCSKKQNVDEVFHISDVYVLPKSNADWIPSDPSKKIQTLNEYIEYMYGPEWIFFKKLKQSSFDYKNADLHADIVWENMSYSVKDKEKGILRYTYQSPVTEKVFLDSNFESGKVTFSFDNEESKEVYITGPKTYYLGDIVFTDVLDISYEVSGSGVYGLELYTLDEELLSEFLSMIKGKSGNWKWEHDIGNCTIKAPEESYAILPNCLASSKWEVKVNENEVIPEAIDSVVKIPLMTGNNQISIVYAPILLKILKIVFTFPFILFCMPGFFALINNYKKKKDIRRKEPSSFISFLRTKFFRLPDIGRRNINWDIVRCTAVFFVLSVHFYLRSGFYNVNFEGKLLFISGIFRNLFITCVPLFLLLSGCTMNKKKLSSHYYFGLVKTLSIYVLSILTFYIYVVAVCHKKASLFDVFNSIVHYEHYSWYVEMYIGLFLLIPFLNIIYWNLDRRQKKVLILTMLFLTSIPGIVNGFDWSRIDAFAKPFMTKSYTLILPNWWIGIYPFTYYFIGAYINEYKDDLPINRVQNLLLIIVNTILSTSYMYFRTNHRAIISGPWTDYNGMPNVITATLILAFILRVNTERVPLLIKKCFVTISKYSFGIYLVSYIFDIENYPKLAARIPNVVERMPYYFIMVTMNFVCSLILAVILYSLYDFIWYVYEYYFDCKEK